MRSSNLNVKTHRDQVEMPFFLFITSEIVCFSSPAFCREGGNSFGEASEVEGSEVEYLLLALDFREVLFLLAGLGSFQAALLEVFESSSHSRAFHRSRRTGAVL